MELDFDKEMDAILRQAARSGELSAANPAATHLDADEISAFSENALPEKTRAVYMNHLADCDRCRTILSNLILLDSETEAEKVSSTVVVPDISELKTPWYQKLFALPNLAYTLGGLVLVFGGFVGFLIFQTSNDSQSEVSQVSDNESVVSGPNIGNDEAFYNSNAAISVNSTNSMSANSTANTATAMSNTMTTTATNANVYIAPAKPDIAAPTPEVLAKEERADTKPMEAQQNQVSPPKIALDGNEKDAATADLALQKRELSNLATVRSQPAPAAPAGRTISEDKKLSARKAAPAEKAKTDSENANTRQISGKTFNRKDNVWYDSAYNNQRTTNVRRGTEDYRKLDSGLRVIAESLDGTVVLIWKEKAYRIQ